MSLTGHQPLPNGTLEAFHHSVDLWGDLPQRQRMRRLSIVITSLPSNSTTGKEYSPPRNSYCDNNFNLLVSTKATRSSFRMTAGPGAAPLMRSTVQPNCYRDQEIRYPAPTAGRLIKLQVTDAVSLGG